MKRKTHSSRTTKASVTDKSHRERHADSSIASKRNESKAFKRLWLAMLLVFGLALVIRFVYLHQLADSPLLSVHMGDAKVYDVWAQQIFSGDWLGSESFYQAPLYPYFLATCFSAFGYDYHMVHIVQIILGSLSCVLLVLVGRQFASLAVGIVAGLILAIYPTAIFFDVLVQKSSLSMFLICVYLALIGSNLHRLRFSMLSLAGVSLGLACLTRENLLVISLITIIWLCLYHSQSAWRHRIIASCCLAGGIVVVLAPLSLRNWYIGSDLLLTTSNVGPNFYIGNGKGATGLYRSLRARRGDAKYERTDAREIAESETGRSLSDHEVNQYWLKRTWQDIIDAPSHWVGLLFRKWIMFWSPTEIADTESLEAYADSSALLHMLHVVMRFDILLILAAMGIGYGWRDWRQQALLYGVLLAIALSITLFFVFSRFRHTALPIVIFFAALGITNLVQNIKLKKYTHCLVVLVISVCIYVLCANTLARIDVVPRGYKPAANTFSNLGETLTTAGRLDEAMIYHQKALSLSPHLSQAMFGIAVINGQRGQFEKAKDILKGLVIRNPDHADAQYLLGLACVKTGDMSIALTAYEQAVRLAPSYANAHNNLATVLLHFNQTEEAIDQFEQAVSINPNHVLSRFNLGMLYFRQGQFDLALTHIEQVLDLSPTDTAARQLYDDIIEAKNNQ